jgi:hypothetical protein
VRDEIENFSESPTEVQMLYHVNFGLPLLDGGSRICLPVKTLIPRNAHAAAHLANWEQYSAPQPGFAEQVYFFEAHADAAGNTRALLKNSGGTKGASLVYNAQQLPCFTLWKNTTGERDGYVTGLEPGTNYPNPRTHEGKHNRVMKLGPGDKAIFEITLETHATAAEVHAAENHVQSLAVGQPTKIFDAPQPGWCA